MTFSAEAKGLLGCLSLFDTLVGPFEQRQSVQAIRDELVIILHNLDWTLTKRS